MDASRRRARPTHGPGLLEGTPRLWALICPALVLVAGACGSDPEAGSLGPDGDDGVMLPPSTEHVVEVRFQLDDAGPLAPRQQRQLTVLLTPPGTHTVRFALVDARDAALDRSSVVSDTDGRAQVWLTAPSSAGPFAVRAHVGGMTADIALSVGARESTTLDVLPVYGGRRTVTEWVASVHENISCASFGRVPPESAMFARFASGESAALRGVPLRQDLAVTVRAGQFAAGCVAVPALTSGDRLRVEVPVSDVPLALGQTQLDIALGLSPGDPAFVAALEDGVELVVQGLRDGAGDDVGALLDEMGLALSGAARSQFEATRAGADWDSLLAAVTGVNPLATTLSRWVDTGRGALLSSRALEGRLGPPTTETEGAPSLKIERMGQIEAARLDLVVGATNWFADASDTLSFAGELSWSQPRLVGEIARGPAVAETGAADVASAFAMVAGCDQIGTTLKASTGSNNGAPSDAPVTCTSSCLTTLCKGALTSMWQRALGVREDATLSVAAAGLASVGEQAQATAVNGHWVGKLTAVARSRETKGEMRGAAPRYSVR